MIRKLPKNLNLHSLLTTPKSEAANVTSDIVIKGSKFRYLFGSEQGDMECAHQLLLDEGAEFSGTQQVQDIYFDNKNFDLLQQGIACCYRETLGQSALILIPIDALGVNHNPAKTLVQWLDIEEPLSSLCIKKLPAGVCKNRLKNTINGKALDVKFNVRLLRNHYNFNSGSNFFNASLDVVTIDRRSLSPRVMQSSSHNEFVLSIPGSDNRDGEQLSVHLGQIVGLIATPSNHFQRALKMEGVWLKQLLQRHRRSLLTVQSGHELLRRTLGNQLQLIQYWYSVAIEDRDTEGVHQMRVAIRHIRSTLKTFAPVLSKSELDQWHAEFRWLGKRLGAVRDLDVFGEWLQHLAELQSAENKALLKVYTNDIEALRKKAIQGLYTTLESDRYQRLIQQFQDWLSQEKCFFKHNSLAYKSTERLAQSLLVKAKTRMRKKLVKVVPGCPSTDLHDFRIECKRLRYSLDSLGCFSGENNHLLEKLCKKLQTELGEHQDVYENAIRIKHYALRSTNVARDGDLVFFLGKIYTNMQQENERQRTVFFNRWKKYKKTLLKFT